MLSVVAVLSGGFCVGYVLLGQLARPLLRQLIVAELRRHGDIPPAIRRVAVRARDDAGVEFGPLGYWRVWRALRTGDYTPAGVPS